MKLIKRFLKLILKISIGTSVIIFLIFFGYVGYCSWAAYKPLMKKKFDSAQWKAARGDTLEERCGM